MKKLNLGCGTDIRKDYINVDCVGLAGVDIVHDLTSLPLPFDNETFDEVLCQDVLEHFAYVPVLKDIHRILKPGGKLYIQVPHFTSQDAYADPTHQQLFSIHTFHYFIDSDPRSYYFDFHFSSIEDIWISFLKMPSQFYNHPIERLVNYNKKTQNYYEKSPMRMFPAWNLNVVLVK